MRAEQGRSRLFDRIIGARTQRSEEPAVLAGGVAVLQGLLDGLLGILALGNLLEGVVGDNALEALELEGVTGGHQVVVVDDLDEGLDAAAAVDELLTHAAGHLQGVALDTGDDGVGEGVRLGASVVGLDNNDLKSRDNCAGQPNSSKSRILYLHSKIVSPDIAVSM